MLLLLLKQVVSVLMLDCKSAMKMTDMCVYLNREEDIFLLAGL